MRSIYGDESIRAVSCPLCLATTGRVLYTVKADESAKVFIRPVSDRRARRELVEIILDLWGTQECRQVSCDECKSVYAWPHRGGDARFYNLAFREKVRYPQDRWEFFAATRFVQPEANGPMLELGAGDGAFVRILRSRGVPAKSISVVEYSDSARIQLAEIDGSIGIFSSLEQFLEISEPNICSHVFAFQVLEHVQQPLEYLQTFRRALRSGGLVCMAVPNFGRIEANERNGLLLDMPPCHVTRFTVEGISALASQAGFEVVHSEVEPVVYSAWLREFLSYHFRRRTQDDASVQNWMERTLPRNLAAAGGALLALPSAVVRSFEPKEGGSLFCVLRAT